MNGRILLTDTKKWSRELRTANGAGGARPVTSGPAAAALSCRTTSWAKYLHLSTKHKKHDRQ